MDEQTYKQTNRKSPQITRLFSLTQATALLPPMKTKKNLAAMAQKSGLIQALEINEIKNKWIDIDCQCWPNWLIKGKLISRPILLFNVDNAQNIHKILICIRQIL